MWYQCYSFVGDKKPETLIVYCIIWIQAPNPPPPPHNFTMESVSICHFKTFQAGNFGLRTGLSQLISISLFLEVQGGCQLAEQ